MTSKIIYAILFFSVFSMNSQVNFEQHLISTEFWRPQIIVAGDMDGDGDDDLIYGGQGDEHIFWTENVDGQGSFEGAFWVGGFFSGLYEIIVTDVDGDNDLDVVGTSPGNHRIIWFENRDGLGDFGQVGDPGFIISESENSPKGLFAADMDGDNDMDILKTSDVAPNFYWQENLDGLGNYGPAIAIFEDSALGPLRVRAFDIDGDGDNDPLITQFGPNGNISWAENLDGQADFGPKTVISQENFSASWVEIIDFDNDQDLDIVAIKTIPNVSGEVLLFRNDGGGNFDNPQVLTTINGIIKCVFPVDFDNDNDYDLVFSSNDLGGLGSIFWVENQGNGTFGPNTLVSDWLVHDTRSLYPSDFDDDGDKDFVVASWGTDKIEWFENTVTLGLDDEPLDSLTLYPNPTSGRIIISSIELLQHIEVFNELGQLVARNSNKKDIDVSHLDSGIYFITLIDQNNLRIMKKIIKE